jgi:thiosulfate dehydrogenase (quinone) large subunit
MKAKTHIRFLITILIIVIGWHLLFEGLVKIFDPSWSSVSYLKGATGPFASLFYRMADTSIFLKIVDIINMYGLFLFGLFLITGLFVRYAAIGGAALLFMYYISNPPFSATGVGYGAEGHYMIVNKNLIEAITLLVVAFLPREMYYGLQNLNLKKFISSCRITPLMEDNNIEPSHDSYNRREVLKNLVWVPFLGSFLFGWSKTKSIGINAITGETIIEEDYLAEDLTEAVHRPNEPIGKAQGIFPGRVSWVYNPLATNPNCTNTTTLSGMHDENDDVWYMDKNTNQEVVDQMVEAAILSITGKNDIKKAWMPSSDTIIKKEVREMHLIKREKDFSSNPTGLLLVTAGIRNL